jgi:cytochrome c oxidase subunit 4
MSGSTSRENGSDTAAVAHAGDDHDHGISHVVSLRLLVAVWAALMVLTVITVGAVQIDLGSTLNLVIAMVIATIKAGLVIAIFMHLWFDKRFNLLVFLSSVLFVVLFITVALQDRVEYQSAIDQFEAAKAAAAAAKAP